MYYTLCRSYRYPDGSSKEKDPSEEQLKLLVSLYGSRSPKLSFSITIDQLAHSGLISGKNDSLGGRKPENKTKKIGRFLLGRTVLNWKILHHSELIMRPNRIF